MAKKYACSVCERNCKTNCILCETCNTWLHYTCNGIDTDDQKKWQDIHLGYVCVSCRSNHDETFDFLMGLERLRQAAKHGIKKLTTAVAREQLLMKYVPLDTTLSSEFETHVQDAVANAMLNTYVCQTKAALRTTGDGDCLFNAVSIILTGDESRSLELKYRCCLEMITNKAKVMNNRSYPRMELLFGDYDKECVECAKPGSYSTAYRIVALSNVLNTPIQSVYPCINGSKDLAYQTLNSVFKPMFSDHEKEKITIMWTNTNLPQMSNQQIQWTPNHFAPLVDVKQTVTAAHKCIFPSVLELSKLPSQTNIIPDPPGDETRPTAKQRVRPQTRRTRHQLAQSLPSIQTHNNYAPLSIKEDEIKEEQCNGSPPHELHGRDELELSTNMNMPPRELDLPTHVRTLERESDISPHNSIPVRILDSCPRVCTSVRKLDISTCVRPPAREIDIPPRVSTPERELDTSPPVNTTEHQIDISPHDSTPERELETSPHVTTPDVLKMLKNHEFVQSVKYVRGTQHPLVTLYTNQQIMDIKRFCCQDKLCQCVLGIDKTYNLGEFQVTSTLYKDMSVIRQTTNGGHPICFGPIFIHQNSTTMSYSSFMHDVADNLSDEEMKQLTIGSDEELPFKNTIRRCFRGCTHVLCILHLRQNTNRYMKDIVGYPAKDRTEIASAIYGETGLLENTDMDTYSARLQNLRQTIDSKDQRVGEKKFKPYFENKLIPVIQKHVIQPVKNGKIKPNWTNNNCKSARHKLKTAVGSDWKGSDMPTFITKLYNIVTGEQVDRCRAMRCRGNFRLADTFAHHHIDIDRWSRMSDEQRAKRRKRFLSDTGKSNPNTVLPTNEIYTENAVSGKNAMSNTDKIHRKILKSVEGTSR